MISIENVKILVISILVLNYLFTELASFLNYKSFKNTIPDLLKDIYDKDKYQKQQNYKLDNYKISRFSSLISLLLILLIIFLNGFGILDNWIAQYTTNKIIQALLFIGILMLLSDIISLPIDLYDTFVIEKKYGFNKTTPKLYIFDKIKSYLLGAILGGGLLALLILIYDKTQEYFALYAWLVFAIFTIFMNMFYSSLIVPLFNKQTKLEQGELKTKINTFADKVGFKVKDIFVIDGSKRSTRANAYFSGFGPKKRIVLYDTLISEMSDDEIVAVLAHEIGHYKKKHIIKSLISSLVIIGITLFILGIFLRFEEFSYALGFEKHSFYSGIISFGILFTPISLITGILTNIFSRRNEFQADNFVKKHGISKNLVSGLKKLSAHNMSNLTPHPFYVFINYSHPPLFERIQNLMKIT